ncbi:hypothetical protein CASFOL_027662 [Castilleja foliolosa]|uniref:Integral membrane bound transporter domain-containing protein n=1 Tax=Castilleja foliolosa TaxID=1961234 RepID=A0ABD3CI06_9LAMI
MSKNTAKCHAQTVWQMRLRSALRTALACTIVAGATLHGPKTLANFLKYPALSYVTIILILSNNASMLGHTLSGCWHALHATLQVVPLAALARWLISPEKGGGMPVGVAAAAASAASFAVTMPESTHMTAKRIALGQISLIFTELVVSIDDTGYGFMNPLHVGASAILGAFASLLALLLPFPGLAHYKVKKLCELYGENASERMSIYLKAFNAKDHKIKTELVLQAKPIAEIGTKLLQNIKALQEGIPWERPWSRYTKNNSMNVENRLQSLELPIRAMEYYLINSSSRVQILDQELSNFSQLLSSQLQAKIEKIQSFSPANSEKESTKIVSDPQSLESNFSTEKNESSFFFSCIDMLLSDNEEKRQNDIQEETESSITQKIKSWIQKLTTKKRLEPAIKYSISLGLSLLMGVILEKENAIWASLAVAISFTTARQPILTTTNAKAQGTAIGSVYGVICCIIFHQQELRLLAIIPWIVFATFLKHSKMYGQTGGASAAIAALFILGRKNYGPEDEFAIARLTSVFIGLFCLVFVEVLLQPIRAATLAKRHLSVTLGSLNELLKETGIYRENELVFSKLNELREKKRTLKTLVAEADSEPDFWYLPFQRCCYMKVAGGLYNVLNMLYVVMYNLEMLTDLKDAGITVKQESEEQLNYELCELQGIVKLSLEKVASIKKSQQVTKEDEKCSDIETGNLYDSEKLSSLITEEVLISDEEIDEDAKNNRDILIRCLGSTVFCVSSLRKEIEQIDFSVKEIVR